MPAHVLDPQDPPPPVRGQLRDAMQHHGIGDRHEREQDTYQDHATRHAEDTGQKRRPEHGNAQDEYQKRAHRNLPSKELLAAARPQPVAKFW